MVSTSRGLEKPTCCNGVTEGMPMPLTMKPPNRNASGGKDDEESQYHRSVRDAHNDRPAHQRRVHAFGRPGWLPDVDAPHRFVPPVRANLRRPSRPGNGL